MAASVVTDAFRAEAAALAAAMAAVPDSVFGQPSPCAPWTVGELLAHVAAAVARVPGMIAAPEPPPGGPATTGSAPAGLVTAADYYRPDQRFSAVTNAARIAAARDGAAGRTPAGLRAAFDRGWQDAWTAAVAASPARRVLTRHGDPMLLTEFMRTRVLEVAVHGLDLAAGTGLRPWLTAPAAQVITEITGAPAAAALRERFGWDDAGLVARLTGRLALTAEQQAVADSRWVTWLALG